MKSVGVILTKDWLQKETNPIKICSKLKDYFPPLPAEAIHQHLVRFGMARSIRKNTVKQMIEKKLWEKVERIYRTLKKEWKGPDIPIFIFPVEASNGILSVDFNGRSGLSFSDKLFLFLSPTVTEKALEAVLMHEYHHVCRLYHHDKDEEEYTLLDTIILEGLAEYVVQERLGEDALTHWMTKYPPSQLRRWWEKWVKDDQNIKPDEEKYIQILYGKGFYPNMLGYALGYEMVKTFYQKNKRAIADTFTISAKTIAQTYETQGGS